MDTKKKIIHIRSDRFRMNSEGVTFCVLSSLNCMGPLQISFVITLVSQHNSLTAPLRYVLRFADWIVSILDLNFVMLCLDKKCIVKWGRSQKQKAWAFRSLSIYQGLFNLSEDAICSAHFQIVESIQCTKSALIWHQSHNHLKV